MNTELSLNGLVKNNNGMFKSESQKDFLLGQRNFGDSFITSKTVHGNTVKIIYSLDDKGVVKVEKHSDKKGTVKVEWERPVEGKIPVQQQKLIKQYQRRINAVKKSLTSRNEAYARGEYEGDEDLYNNVTDIDLDLLEGLRHKLKELTEC